MKGFDSQSHSGTKKDLRTIECKRKVQQKLGLTSIQQPLKSLLYRNRSLRSLFEGTSSHLQIVRTQKHQNDRLNAKNDLAIKRITNQHLNKLNGLKQQSNTKNQYLIGYKNQQQNEMKQRIKQLRKKEEMERFKIITNQKNKILQCIQLSKNPMTKSYDPQSYNWRKSLKKQRIHTTFQDNLSSPLQSKMLLSEYYVGNVGHSGNSEKQKYNKQEKKRSILLQKKEKRSKSLTSKPKVIKNVFQLRSPRGKYQQFVPQNSLQFTFGL